MVVEEERFTKGEQNEVRSLKAVGGEVLYNANLTRAAGASGGGEKKLRGSAGEEESGHLESRGQKRAFRWDRRQWMKNSCAMYRSRCIGWFSELARASLSLPGNSCRLRTLKDLMKMKESTFP